jgi:integrase
MAGHPRPGDVPDQLQACDAHFGEDRVIASITSADIQSYGTAQLDATPPSAPATINRRLACLGRMFGAMSELPDGPKAVPRIKYLPELGSRKFSFTHAQEAKMFEAVAKLDEVKPGPKGGYPRKQDARLYLRLFKFLVETGVRLSEALRLRWTDVQGLDGDVCVIRLHRTKEIKNNKARSIPLTGTPRSRRPLTRTHTSRQRA